MKDYILALDQGTTSSRCIVFNRQGHIMSVSQKEFTQIYPKPGWVEHNPLEIWSSQLGVMMEAMGNLGISACDIEAIGITNQRETTIVWDRETGKPVYNAIVWQCRRSADRIDQIEADGMAERIKAKTGLKPDAYFSATKIAWILDHVEGARERAERGELLFGTVDTWLIWNLTGGQSFVTDYTNASRTMLFNIHTLEWDREILEYLRIPVCMLPKVQASSGLFGNTATQVIGGVVPIMGVAGDQQAALFGQCCFEPGEAKNTYGTGCFLLMNTGSKAMDSKNGLLTTIAASMDDWVEYALEGSVFVAGATVQWLRDELRMLKTAADSEQYCTKVPDTGGVYVVPAFTGLGAPYWESRARGMVVGMTRGTQKEHFIRAAIESLAYQSMDALKAMEKDAETTLKTLKVDGGATANNFLMQFQADILNIDVYRPACIESTALGACFLAGLATGYFKDKNELREIVAAMQDGRHFIPSMSEADRAERQKGWQRAVKCAAYYAELEE